MSSGRLPRPCRSRIEFLIRPGQEPAPAELQPVHLDAVSMSALSWGHDPPQHGRAAQREGGCDAPTAQQDPIRLSSRAGPPATGFSGSRPPGPPGPDEPLCRAREIPRSRQAPHRTSPDPAEGDGAGARGESEGRQEPDLLLLPQGRLGPLPPGGLCPGSGRPRPEASREGMTRGAREPCSSGSRKEPPDPRPDYKKGRGSPARHSANSAAPSRGGGRMALVADPGPEGVRPSTAPSDPIPWPWRSSRPWGAASAWRGRPCPDRS